SETPDEELHTPSAQQSACPKKRGGLPKKTSKQPFDGKMGKQPDPHAPPEAGSRFYGVHDRVAVTLFDPYQLTGIIQAHTIGNICRLPFESRRKLTGQHGAVDDEADFGVEPGGARIEVERTDEYALAVDRQR